MVPDTKKQMALLFPRKQAQIASLKRRNAEDNLKGWPGKMKIWGEALVENIICWFLASVNYLKVWQPLIQPVQKSVKIPLFTILRAPDSKLGRQRLSRGPTFLTRRPAL